MKKVEWNRFFGETIAAAGPQDEVEEDHYTWEEFLMKAALLAQKAGKLDKLKSAVQRALRLIQREGPSTSQDWRQRRLKAMENGTFDWETGCIPLPETRATIQRGSGIGMQVMRLRG